MSDEGGSGTDAASMLAVLTLQRNAFLAEGVVTAAVRKDRLQRAIDLLVDHGDALCDAMSADFGYRPRTMSRLTDIASSTKGAEIRSRQSGSLDEFGNTRSLRSLSAAGG
jgi:coniferyl-aldehyde dehydrogenase